MLQRPSPVLRVHRPLDPAALRNSTLNSAMIKSRPLSAGPPFLSDTSHDRGPLRLSSSRSFNLRLAEHLHSHERPRVDLLKSQFLILLSKGDVVGETVNRELSDRANSRVLDGLAELAVQVLVKREEDVVHRDEVREGRFPAKQQKGEGGRGGAVLVGSMGVGVKVGGKTHARLSRFRAAGQGRRGISARNGMGQSTEWKGLHILYFLALTLLLGAQLKHFEITCRARHVWVKREGCQSRRRWQPSKVKLIEGLLELELKTLDMSAHSVLVLIKFL